MKIRDVSKYILLAALLITNTVMPIATKTNVRAEIDYLPVARISRMGAYLQAVERKKIDMTSAINKEIKEDDLFYVVVFGAPKLGSNDDADVTQTLAKGVRDIIIRNRDNIKKNKLEYRPEDKDVVINVKKVMEQWLSTDEEILDNFYNELKETIKKELLYTYHVLDFPLTHDTVALEKVKQYKNSSDQLGIKAKEIISFIKENEQYRGLHAKEESSLNDIIN